MENFLCGGYVFNSNFDSGNLAKVELVNLIEDMILIENFTFVEFNIWTKPDCAGTIYENPNRSWFMFSIHGGKTHQACKINVVNLNKQAKLFSQGMSPVMKVGEWERMKDNPTYLSDNDNFTLTFYHKPLANTSEPIYYAFTFPFTYTDCQNQLKNFELIHGKTEQEIDFIVQRLQGSMHGKTDEDSSDQYVQQVDDESNEINRIDQLCNEENKYVKMPLNELANEIYIHRDLLIKSVEGRCVDLVTISSFHGIQGATESRLNNLFPNYEKRRCNVFKDKKIIFISSRVHPGETPASFVLNGFFKLILDTRSVVAATLRYYHFHKDLHDSQGNEEKETKRMIDENAAIFTCENSQLLDYQSAPSCSADSSRSQSTESDIYEQNVYSKLPKCDREDLKIKTQSHERKMGKVFLDELITEIKPIIITNPSVFKKPFKIRKQRSESAKMDVSVGEQSTVKTVALKQSSSKNVMMRNVRSSNVLCPPFQVAKRKQVIEEKNLNFSAEFTPKLSEKETTEKSDMFLYIDLHGHASKKGIFMYGNHLTNASEAVECMLLPRLMSMNCSHFHFDACVFSERNMYHKGKRDGLSKEGSGRVAIFKTIGLIKSYTLEGNYNTGRYVNVLPPIGKNSTTRNRSLLVPKYTPAIFEEVGKALGPSILDLTGSNPLSRLPNSEFKNLQGLCNSLRSDIDKPFTRTVLNTTKALTTKAKRMKNPTLCSSMPLEVSKENKVKLSLNKQQVTTTYGKKEGTNRKKGKVLCDVLTSAASVATKRPKVLSAVAPIDSKIEPKKCAGIECADESIAAVIDAVDLPLFYAVESSMLTDMAKQTTKELDVDLNSPCCSSRCIPTTSGNSILLPVGMQKTKKTGNFAGNSTSSGKSSSTKKTSSVTRRSKLGNGNLLKSLRRSKTNLSKDNLRIKKKKMLKADTNLKRKKSRVF